MIYKEIDEISNDRVCSSLIGMKKEKFKELLLEFEKYQEEEKLREYNDGERKRKSGGGAKGNLDTVSKKLFFVLYYMKNYPTYDVLGYLFDMDGGNACSHIQVLSPLVHKALEMIGVMPKRELQSPTEFEQLIENDEIIIDATERRCVRPVDKDKQKLKYSGKKKAHTLKNTVIVSISRKIIFIGKTVNGSIHDYKLLKNELNHKKDWFKNNKVYVDLGYLGIKKDYSFSTNVFIPHKKPKKSKNNPDPQLTKQQKEENKELSKKRVVVENVIGGVKTFRCLSDRFRNHNKLLEDIFIGISSAIWNFKLPVISTT